MRLLSFACMLMAASSFAQEPDIPTVSLNFKPKQGQISAYTLRVRTTVGDMTALMSASLLEHVTQVGTDENYEITPRLSSITVEKTAGKAKPQVSKEPDRAGRMLAFTRLGVMLGHGKEEKKDADDYAIQRYFFMTSPGIPIFEGVGWHTDWQSAQYPKVPKVSVDYELTGFSDWNGTKCAVVKITTAEGSGAQAVTGSGKCLVEPGAGIVCQYLITLDNVLIPGTKSRGTLTCFKELVR